ncbi:hypothetical protein FA95DRAFT_1613389 [Auriscalpium vulgare]|uniref:Uncharacterized protein n=1 Tax=Auriscalpium vulgare TaxID=40419 RepID=A0ACB8R2W2_9AGAM|nr:hypothetical protein FA95DRAFT_1613389 [Auriscalpium vulgare]
MTRITITLDVPTDDLADRLANMNVSFSPKKESAKVLDKGSRDTRVRSATPTKSAPSAVPAKSVPSTTSATSDAASVDEPAGSDETSDESQEPWVGRAWAVMKGVEPGVYKPDSDEFHKARGVTLYAVVRKYATYNDARAAFDNAKRAGDTCKYSKEWDERSRNGLPPRV